MNFNVFSVGKVPVFGVPELKENPVDVGFDAPFASVCQTSPKFPVVFTALIETKHVS
jgi:hypothetical protein